MAWGLAAKLGMQGLRAATTLPGALTIGAATTVVPAMMGQEDRKREIVLQGEQGGFHKRNLTDKVFNALGLVDIDEDSLDAAKVAYLQEQYGPLAGKYGMTAGEDGNYFTKGDTLQGAKVKVDTAGEDYTTEKARRTAIQLDQDRYDSPTARRERMRQDQARNDALITAAENKLEAEKIRQEGRAEQRELLAQQGIQNSEDRKLTLQLEAMRDKRAFAERKDNAQMAMVAALTRSLGDLGDAFVSI